MGDLGQSVLELVHDDVSCAYASFSCGVFWELVQARVLVSMQGLVPE